MANHRIEDDMASLDRFDGAFRCRLCPDPSPREDNDWCPVVEGVACEDCCRALMLGDDRMLAAVSRRRGAEVTSKEVVSRCMECPRLVRLVSEHALADESDGAHLPMH